MSAIGSGAPRPNTSRPSCGRVRSAGSAASRIASRRRKPQRERGRHVLGARPRIAVALRQQQARFEVGEPRRHHQIVGGELEPQRARLLDEGEILVGERQDRDLRQVDLLLARERRAADRAGPRSPRRRRSAPARRRRAPATMPSNDLVFVAHARLAIMRGELFTRRRDIERRRACAAPRAPHRRAAARIAGELRASRRDRLHLVELAVAMKHHIAAGAQAPRGVRSASVPDSALMDTSSLINRPSKPMMPRITSPTIVAGSGGRRDRVDAREHNMRRHPQREVWRADGTPRNRSPPSVARSALDHRQRGWLSAVARPCPGMCLSTGSTPPVEQPFGDGRADRRDLGRRRRRRRGRRSPGRPRSTGTSASGRQSTSMPSAAEIVRDQPGAELRGRKPRGAVAVVERAVEARRADSSASAAARAAAPGRPPGRSAPGRCGRRVRATPPPGRVTCAGVSTLRGTG